MFKNRKIIKELKKLRETPVNESFLKTLRTDLEEYMSYNPVREEIKQPEARSVKSPFFHIGQLKYAVVPVIIGVIILGGGGAAFASQESLPGEILYPIKLATEEVRSALTFKPETKAKLQVKFIEKRIKEIEELIEEKGIGDEGLEIAQEKLEVNLAKVADIIEEAEEEGKEVAELASEVVEDFQIQIAEAKKVFAKVHEEVVAKRSDLYAKLAVVKIKNGGDAERAIKEEIVKIDSLKLKVERHREKALVVLDAGKERLYEKLDEVKRNKHQRKDAVEFLKEIENKLAEKSDENGMLEEARAQAVKARALFEEGSFIDVKQAAIQIKEAISLIEEKEILEFAEELIGDMGLEDEIEDLFDQLDDYQDGINNDEENTDDGIIDPSEPTSFLRLKSQGASVVWATEGEERAGYKLVWSRKDNPTYPTREGDKYKYLAPGIHSTEVYPFDGSGVYYVRVCEYLGDGKCGRYSNQIEITLEKLIETGDIKLLPRDNKDGQIVSKINLRANGTVAHWVTDGNAQKGFKLVWSKKPHPTYPTREFDKYKYFSNTTTSSAKIYPHGGSGVYYVRVCEYLGAGVCGTYSNEVRVEVIFSGPDGGSST